MKICIMIMIPLDDTSPPLFLRGVDRMASLDDVYGGAA